MFIQPAFRSVLSEKTFRLSEKTAVSLPEGMSEGRKAYIKSALSDTKGGGEALCASVSFLLCPLTKEILGADVSTGHKEEYAVRFGADTVVFAPAEEGLLLGLSALRQATESGESQEGVLYSYPPFPLRGYRAFLPGTAGIADFCRTVDMLAYYQYNLLDLEVGGAMEYKKHPEINRAWIPAAQKFRAESGLTHKVQNVGYWLKNSIHCDNGDGEVLSQDTVKDLLSYCRDRGILVIPEVPTLSHCDYLLLPHPELAERPYDSYPDTYCPHHPDVYPYVFDVLDEVCDVFQPTYLNIGHDECYSLATDTCPRCRNEVPSDLYAKDVVTLSSHLRERGVKTVMWGEKLLDVHVGRHSYGGAERMGVNDEGKPTRLSPYLADCRYQIPREVTMLHWYWVFDEAHDRVYAENGFPMVYGNASLCQLLHWNERKKHTLGAFASNWGSYAPAYMQRNLQYFDIVYNSAAIAGHGYDGDESHINENVDCTMAECFRYLHRGYEDVLEIVHTTDAFIKYKFFYDGVFVEDGLYHLGDYEVTFDDGFVAKLPVSYGEHVSCADAEKFGDLQIADTFLEQKNNVKRCSGYKEVGGRCLPFLEGNTVWYRAAYPNPHPHHAVTSYRYLPLLADVRVRSVEIKNL